MSPETYRAWDSGRRAVPDGWMDKARALAAAEDPDRLRALQELATELGVNVRTLRDAVRAGRYRRPLAQRPVPGCPQCKFPAFNHETYSAIPASMV